MTLTWAMAAHEVIVRMAAAISGARCIVNAPSRKPVSFRNLKRARKGLIATGKT
jgi:hypothetical protein